MPADDSDLPFFARRLKELRTAAKMTQKELAERTGMHLGGIFKLEQGVNRPSWDTVQLLALALGVPVGAFVDPAIIPPPVEVKRRRSRPRFDESDVPPAPAKRTRKRQRKEKES